MTAQRRWGGENDAATVGRVWDLVEQIFASGHEVVMATTGGGSQAVTWLLNHPGASRVMLEVQVPYADRALEEYLAVPGPHGVTADTARLMAARAFARTQRLSRARRDVSKDPAHLGIGCTAALATDRQRRGDDHCWAAARTADRYHMVEFRFEKGAATRLEQEEVLSAALVHTVGYACGLRGDALSEQLPEWATSESFELPASEALDRFFDDGCDVVERAADRSEFRSDVAREQRLVYAGSFDPFHEGHRDLARAAQSLCGREAALEISSVNVDKPTLGYVEVATRLQALPTDFSALVTRVATFPEKARLFPGAVFVIGYDTAIRLVDASYYGGGRNAVDDALTELRERHCSFLVAGRLHEGAFRQLDDIPIPRPFQDLFRAVPQELFRRDISSTQLRRAEPLTDMGAK